MIQHSGQTEEELTSYRKGKQIVDAFSSGPVAILHIICAYWSSMWPKFCRKTGSEKDGEGVQHFHKKLSGYRMDNIFQPTPASLFYCLRTLPEKCGSQGGKLYCYDSWEVFRDMVLTFSQCTQDTGTKTVELVVIGISKHAAMVSLRFFFLVVST